MQKAFTERHEVHVEKGDFQVFNLYHYLGIYIITISRHDLANTLIVKHVGQTIPCSWQYQVIDIFINTVWVTEKRYKRKEISDHTARKCSTCNSRGPVYSTNIAANHIYIRRHI